MQAPLRIFAALVFAFSLTQPLTAAALKKDDLAAFAGRWTMAGAAGAPSSLRVTANTTTSYLMVTLPDSPQGPGNRTVRLDRVDATRFRSADGADVRVDFVLKSPGQAELTVKYWTSHAWHYWDADLTRS